MHNETRVDILSGLKELRIPAFRTAYVDQINHEEQYIDMSFDDRLALLVQNEVESRSSKDINKRIRQARFENSGASIEEINYAPQRNIDKNKINSLATNTYIERGINVIITGPAGCGKSYIAQALGVNACVNHFSVFYYRLPDLFERFHELFLIQDHYKLRESICKVPLLILDEFLLHSTTQKENEFLLTVMDRRYGKRSTIFCSHYEPPVWHKKLGGGPEADSILDRIVHNSYKFNLQGASMRSLVHAEFDNVT